jgi:hypothetical protein
MSRVVKIRNGNYRVAVTNDLNPSTATIYLDTGPRTGNTIVTGNLTVQGIVTTVQSNNVTITDNIILLNSGESGSSVTLGTSGLEIDRGTSASGNAQLLFDESLNAFNLTYKTSGAYIPIATNRIKTNGGNLTLIGSGTGVVSVTGTVDYETHVVDDDTLTNKKYVDDKINTSIVNSLASKIGQDDSLVQVLDSSVTFNPTVVTVTIDGTIKAQFDSSGLIIDNRLRINQNTISNNSGNLVFSSTNNVIQFNGRTLLANQISDPSATSNFNTLYSKLAIGTGRTGLYYTNTTISGELINKNRALLWAMLF